MDQPTSAYRNPNVRWILAFSAVGNVSQSILWFSTTWLIYGLGGSNSDLGAILGYATLISVVVTFIASSIADRWRNDVVIWIGTILAVVGMYLLASAQSLNQVFIGQVMTNIGGSSVYPVLASIFANSTTAKTRNRVFGTQFLISNTANASGNILGFFLFRNLTTTNVEDLDVNLIRTTLFAAFLFYILAFLFILMVRDSKMISEHEEGSIATEFRVEGSEESGMGSITPSKSFRKSDFSPGSLQILVLTFLSAYIIGAGAGTTIPFLPRLFFDIYSIKLSDLSLLMAFMTLVTAVWGKVVANNADKFGRVEMIAVNQMVSVLLLFVLSTYPPVFFAMLTLIVRNAAMNGTGPISTALQMEYSPRKYRSKINALNTISWAVFYSGGQIIGGRLVDAYGFRPNIIITASLYFIATVLYLRINKIMGLKIFNFGRQQKSV